MLGPGFIKARNLLSELKESKYRYLFHLDSSTLSEKLNLIFRLYQMIIDSWQLKDYGLVGEFLMDQDYKAVAERLKKDRSLTRVRQS
jgi:hypothetical protein